MISESSQYSTGHNIGGINDSEVTGRVSTSSKNVFNKTKTFRAQPIEDIVEE